ncbi:putative aminoacyltransferase, E1 ubiquitin-activating enzyme [Rosa chinensis]|uniref:RING-type E3 ubiquitin transferase n=1 Tax=Rosa chinensis TaxID=74649 RepID=A0A2P6P4R7_ROSCH|nr:E3 ubiquitin-protein ligase RING1 [Rosa chinensis]PRQ16906.1 putative aminoacyltransferase, E1 ubiquitin-activating enzyme [Rosa chinensis]
MDATIRLYDNDETIVEWIAPDSLQRFLPGLMPATKSSIEGLEKVRLESLEATVRLTHCVICKEGLDHFDDDVEEGLVTRLPCSHLYHGDCIVQWLETSNLCPLCRYPMPVMEEEEQPSKPSGARLSWPVLLTVSAGGIIAAVLLCRLLKRS